MRIVINHLTRMQKGFMCVAGIDQETGRHVRPMLQSQMRTKFLARHGGPFDIGAIVDLGWTKHVGEPPAVEDFLFHRSEARRVGNMPPDEFWRVLQQAAKPKFGAVFGPELKQRGRNSYAVDEGKGSVSLGCYRLQSPSRLLVQRWSKRSRGRIRLEFQCGEYEFELGVTDIRLYGSDHFTPDDAVVEQTNVRLQSEVEVILSVGLSRPYSGNDDREPLHWLQVNNIHFGDNPSWLLGR